ncbi:PASTA domain-containing protein [Rhodococcus sp. ACS1]|uniref:PASTA domain-containing protein n=1 Tax=Rhodococcus sp. ACS1 TaxID=2028570 RepID=UPI0015C79796|nr:DUF732 domain-containing protein [Rhodococcus sp. ACS1]
MLGKRLGAVIAAALTGIVLTACDDKMSSGATSDVIPDVIGMTLLDAKDELDPTGLDVETIDITGQDRMVLVEGNWFVAGQDLLAGQPAGDRTTITLSIGKEGEARAPEDPSPPAQDPPAVVPEVVGMKLPDAKAAIEALGLDVELHDDTGGNRSVFWEHNWTVSSQSVAGGDTVAAGQVLTLGVLKDGEHPPTTTVQAPAPSTTVDDEIAQMDPATQTAINDATYLGTLELGGIAVGDEQTAIAAGHTLCSDLSAGTDPFMIRYAMIKSSMDRNAPVSGDEAQWILEAAAVAYCPEFTADVTNSGFPR